MRSHESNGALPPMHNCRYCLRQAFSLETEAYSAHFSLLHMLLLNDLLLFSPRSWRTLD